MWQVKKEKLLDVRGAHYSISRDSLPASFAEVVDAWQNDDSFSDLFNGLLADAPFEAFRWETPGVTTESMPQPFKFVLLDNPGLARHPDRSEFAEHLTGATETIIAFANLTGTATLVVPCPIVHDEAYGHLAAFVRLAPESQRRELWQAVGREMEKRVGVKPVWLSTAGGGVSWLHVRLDDRPKYYGYEPYRTITTSEMAKDAQP
jgi:hypothetical protein